MKIDAKPTSGEQKPLLDIEANRRAQKWTSLELIKRGIWEIGGQPLFRLIPRQFWGLRNQLLRAFGAKIGVSVRFHPSVAITIPWNLLVCNNASVGDRATIYNLGMVTIGENASISQNAHICAGSHDFNKPDLPLTKPPIFIGDGAWVCADAFVGPGVVLGAYSIVGARAVVMRDVAPHVIVVGNPAQVIKARIIPSRN